MIHEIIHEVRTAKTGSFPEKRYWSALPKFPEVCPQFYQAEYGEDGSLQAFHL